MSDLSTVGRRSKLPLTVAIVAGFGALILVWQLVSPSAARPAGDCVRLVVNSSTEKAALIDELAGRYNGEGRVFGDRLCATIEVHATTSGMAMASLAAGWETKQDSTPAPQVWLPTSSLWLGLLEQKGKGDLVSGDHPSITKSVLTVAMPKKMADVVRANNPSPGWTDVLQLATKDWASLGHPEWKNFALGRDNPHFSTSGLATTIAIYHAAAKKREGITEADLVDANVISFVHGVESSVARYGDDATKFMELLYEEDGKKPAVPVVSAIVVQEQLAFLYNQGSPGGDPSKLGSGAPNDPLVAIHPNDGTFELDHPYVVLSGASDAQKAAAADFRAFLTDDEQQTRFTDLGFRHNDGRPSEELTETLDFRGDQLPELIRPPAPDLIDKMLAGWDRHRRLARVLLVLDVSGSMKEPADPMAVEGPLAGRSKMDLLRPAAKQGLSWLGNNDEVGLWTFSSDPPFTVQVPMAPAGEVRQQLANVIDTVPADGNTALYTTARAAHQAMVDSIDPDKINAIVFLSDGVNTPVDEAGRAALINAVDATQLDTSVRIFTIPYGSKADVDTLAQIAAASKALTYDATNPVDINEVFVSVFSNF